FSRAGDESSAARYLALAGDEAHERAAHASAAEFYRQALSYRERAGESEPAPLQEKLGDALYLSGRYDDAISPLERALDRYQAGFPRVWRSSSRRSNASSAPQTANACWRSHSSSPARTWAWGKRNAA